MLQADLLILCPTDKNRWKATVISNPAALKWSVVSHELASNKALLTRTRAETNLKVHVEQNVYLTGVILLPVNRYQAMLWHTWEFLVVDPGRAQRGLSALAVPKDRSVHQKLVLCSWCRYHFLPDAHVPSHVTSHLSCCDTWQEPRCVILLFVLSLLPEVVLVALRACISPQTGFANPVQSQRWLILTYMTNMCLYQEWYYLI